MAPLMFDYLRCRHAFRRGWSDADTDAVCRYVTRVVLMLMLPLS